MADFSPSHVLLNPWPGPFGGVPPWDEVDANEFLNAFDAAINEAASEYKKIANESSPPTFHNTLVPMEQAGQTLARLQAVFSVHAANLNVGPIPELQKQVMPLLAAHRDTIIQNQMLFDRIQRVYQSDEMAQLSVAQQRLVEDQYQLFVRYGAKLDAANKSTLTDLNQRLASLFAVFTQNVLDDEQEHVTWIDAETDLAGLPTSLIGSMKNAARDKDHANKWAVLNTRSVVDPFLTYADNRSLREKVWRTFYNRGDNGDAHDNNAIIQEILKLRAQRANLLGYQTHAHWALERSMAKTPHAAMDLMVKIWPKAVARVEEEVADMRAIAHEMGHSIQIEAWDYRYYAEKVRKAKFDLDLNEVKPYLQLEKLIDAMLWCSTKLFGLAYHRNDSVPKFHDDVRVWEVTNNQGHHVGLFYLDPYAREGKRSGAWMTDYRCQYNMGVPVTPLVSNNSNFVKAAAGEPELISWDDAETLFHEFGHGLHGLLSNVQFPSQSGTSVARDYVEFPSQIYEHWLSTQEVLSQFCVHCETGEPIPQAMVEKIGRAAKFNQGYATVEYLASAIMDMKLHLAGDADIDPREFESRTLADLGMPKEMVMRHRTPHFLHLFSDDGYSAAYYSYLWADALTADAAEAFAERGSFFDEELAKRLHDDVLSVGDTVDPAEGFRAFRGRDVDTQALLRKRGFPVDDHPASNS